MTRQRETHSELIFFCFIGIISAQYLRACLGTQQKKTHSKRLRAIIVVDGRFFISVGKFE